MYMDRIVAPVAAITEQPTRSAPRIFLTLVVGLAFLGFSILVMVPYLAALAVFVVAAVASRQAARVAGTLYKTVLYSGEMILGR